MEHRVLQHSAECKIFELVLWSMPPSSDVRSAIIVGLMATLGRCEHPRRTHALINSFLPVPPKLAAAFGFDPLDVKARVTQFANEKDEETHGHYKRRNIQHDQ